MEVDSKTLADIFGVTTKTLRDWGHKGLPVVVRQTGPNGNTYNTVDCLAWWRDQEIQRRVVTQDGKHYDKQEEEARLKHHQANMEQLKEEEKRGELIPLDVAVSEFGQLVGNARSKILQLGKLVPKKHRDKLNEGITLALDELSEAEPVI
jgi:phage terminase Nu1 subunit (DNA packaging protein)